MRAYNIWQNFDRSVDSNTSLKASTYTHLVTPLVRVVLYDHIASYNLQSLQSIVSPHVCVRMSMFIHFV